MSDTLEEFLKGIETPEESLLNKPLIEEKDTPEEEEISLETEQRLKNRLMRKKEKEADRLRDEVTQLNERVKVLSELGKFKEEVGDDTLKKVEAIYGTDTAEKLAATNLLKEALADIKRQAKEETMSALGARETEETEAQKEADSEVDEMLEQVEDEYGLDMSDDNVRNGYITLMEKMSRKYDDGNIKEFADPDAVADVYLTLQKRQGSTKAKELASRSMQRSGESQPSKLPQNAVDRFMEENGLTGNW